MIKTMDNPKCKARLSILLKTAELLYRDIDKMKRKDAAYYLGQIIEEVRECERLLHIDINPPKDF